MEAVEIELAKMDFELTQNGITTLNVKPAPNAEPASSIEPTVEEPALPSLPDLHLID
jgi:hypothetical protein